MTSKPPGPRHGLALPAPEQSPVARATECARATKEVVLLFSEVEEGRAQEVPIYKLGENLYGFVAGLQIDVDGAPSAYHPDNIGLDYLANAGMPILDSGRTLQIDDPEWQRTWKTYYNRARAGHFLGPTQFVWHAMATDGNNVPIVQGADDPCPGYYVSQTSLVNARITDEANPRRYVDSCEIPYLALPPAVLKATGTAMGDLAVVLRPDNNASAFAIVADVGPSRQLGEGSVKLSQLLGHNPIRNGEHPRVVSGLSRDLYYLLFPGSGQNEVLGRLEIEAKGRALLETWGGVSQHETIFPVTTYSTGTN